MSHGQGRVHRRSVSALSLALGVLVLAGCASAPPTPITSAGPIAGKWAGTVFIAQSQQLFYLTINPDGTFTATWESSMSWGRITGFRDGQALFEMAPPPREGTLTLYDTRGKRQLVMENLSGGFSGQVTPEE